MPQLQGVSRQLAFAMAVVFGGTSLAAAEQLTQITADARITLFFQTENDALQKLLPPGWVVAPLSGAFQGANLTMTFVDSLFFAGPDGKARPGPKYAVPAIPAKNQQTETTASIVVGGFASPSDAAPGAYGNYVPAKFVLQKASRTEEDGRTIVDETWDISTEAGDKIRLQATYERGLGTRAHVEPRVYSAAKPGFFRIYKVDQVTDILQSASNDPGRMKKLEFSAFGPQLSSVLKSNAQPIGALSVPSYQRQIFLPD